MENSKQHWLYGVAFWANLASTWVLLLVFCFAFVYAGTPGVNRLMEVAGVVVDVAVRIAGSLWLVYKWYQWESWSFGEGARRLRIWAEKRRNERQGL